MDTKEKVWFITGVSSGLGKQIAKEVLAKGKLLWVLLENKNK